jgi:hypothetical protein
MINTQIFQQALSVKVQPSSEDYLEYSRILAAAIVNPQFCTTLLADPGEALRNGYQGETFQLSDDGWTWLVSTSAVSLPELAGQLAPVFDRKPYTSSTYFAQTPRFIEHRAV